MPRSKDVVLAGKTYKVEQLPMKANKRWRDTLGAPVMQLITLIQDFGSLELKPSDLLRIVNLVKELLLGSMDTMLDALFSYSPALMADRKRIENEAYDDEAIAALGVVVSLAYPLDQLLTNAFGFRGMQTITNSPSQNGGNGTMLSAAGPQKRTKRT